MGFSTCCSPVFLDIRLSRYSLDRAGLQVSRDFVQKAGRDDSLSGEPFGGLLVGQHKPVSAIIQHTLGSSRLNARADALGCLLHKLWEMPHCESVITPAKFCR